MNEIPDSRALLALFFAVFIAIKVGIPVSNARNEAVLSLVSKCPAFLLGTGEVTQFVNCGVGVFLFLLIPGTIGFGLWAYRSP